MKKLNLLIFFVLITILTSDISTQADIKNKELYFELENKAVKNEDSLKDILEFSTQLKKSGEVNYKGKIYNISLQKDNLSIGGKERRVVGINIVNKDSLHILEQYFIAYNNDRSIDYFKLLDVKDANKDSWVITDYPVDYDGWAIERRYYDDKKKNIQYGGWKQKDADKWIFGALNPADPKSGSKEIWLTWGTKVKYIESHAGLSKEEQEKLYRIAEKRFEEASEVKKLLINIKKKYYAQIQQNNIKNYAKNEFIFKNLEDIKENLAIDGSPFTMSLENLDSGEKNISVSIKKSKSLAKGLSDSVVWTTKFTYLSKAEKTQDGKIGGGLSRSYSITEYEEFPNYKVERAKRGLGQISKHINLPKETELYKITKSNSLIINDISYLSNESIMFGEDNGYLSWSDFALRGNNIKERTIVEGIGSKQGKLKKIIGGLCKNPNDLFKAMYKKYVNNCDLAFLDAFNDTKRMVNVHFDNILNKKLQKKLLANLENQRMIISNDEKYYALIIGNNDYQHLEKLDAAENDAVVIADVLEKKYGFEVDLLLNADYDQTVNSLFKITDKLKRNDNLLIYYAGHGELDKDENRGYWLPVDASYEMRSKWISNQRIVDRIKATKAKHVLLVADSCFSGTLMRSGGNLEKEQSIDEKYIKRLKNKKTRLVITSGGNEPVVDSVGGDHSLFALKFIDTLKNSNTVINSQILFENVRRYVVANADQTPERAMVHKTGHDGGDFLFFPKK